MKIIIVMLAIFLAGCATNETNGVLQKSIPLTEMTVEDYEFFTEWWAELEDCVCHEECQNDRDYWRELNEWHNRDIPGEEKKRTRTITVREYERNEAGERIVVGKRKFEVLNQPR